jgi:aminomethyltransferase
MAGLPDDIDLSFTPLHDWHVEAGARMVPFAGYSMPVQYTDGILTEHNFTREKAGLFDVSHMGQALLVALDRDHETVARALERLVPADILNLKPGQQRYTQLLNEEGGILDDLMVTRPVDPRRAGTLVLVVNAACKAADFAHIEASLDNEINLVRRDDRALIALQGPAAARTLAQHVPGIAKIPFMSAVEAEFDAKPVEISRSGYTGEDGYEISVPASRVVQVWSALMRSEAVKAIGLGARDSLRLEAGLCLYGHDIDTTTSPVEAGLTWSIQKRRRETGGFPGFSRILRELREGPPRLRVGIRPDGRQPAREGTEIFSGDRKIGIVTSGGFGPTVQAPVAMGYVEAAFAKPDTPLTLLVRGKELPARVSAMPFAPHRYFR